MHVCKSHDVTSDGLQIIPPGWVWVIYPTAVVILIYTIMNILGLLPKCSSLSLSLFFRKQGEKICLKSSRIVSDTEVSQAVIEYPLQNRLHDKTFMITLRGM